VPAPSTTIVVADASVLINLIHIRRLELLATFEGLAFVIPEEVVQEISDQVQAAALAQALEQGYVRAEACAAPAELALFADLRPVLGKGESACLAIAEHRGWMVACDERGAFLREARRRIGEGRLLNTPGLMLLAIRRSKMTVAEADEAKKVLEGRRFTMKFGSFQELL